MQEQDTTSLSNFRYNAHSPEQIQTLLSDIMAKEAQALMRVVNDFPLNAWELVQYMAQASGKVIFSGVGKSGLVAQKLAASCSSLGVSSFFLHPSDALHGDLGAVQKNDLFIALSRSGSGSEFDYIFPVIQSYGVMTALICCGKGGLAAKADLVLHLPFDREACEYNLAPTSSSTVMMAFGDALALVTSTYKGFTAHDFARNHPAGALGKRLLLTVKALMHDRQCLPIMLPSTPFKEVLVAITSKKLGLGIVVDEHDVLKGIITDGDLRRACELGPALFDKKASDLATQNPKTISPNTLAYVALELMEDFNITSLVVVDAGIVVGVVHIHDLIKAGIQS